MLRGIPRALRSGHGSARGDVGREDLALAFRRRGAASRLIASIQNIRSMRDQPSNDPHDLLVKAAMRDAVTWLEFSRASSARPMWFRTRPPIVAALRSWLGDLRVVIEEETVAQSPRSPIAGSRFDGSDARALFGRRPDHRLRVASYPVGVSPFRSLVLRRTWPVYQRHIVDLVGGISDDELASGPRPSAGPSGPPSATWPASASSGWLRDRGARD